MSSTLSVPHRLQFADGYCLPACVEMVLAYWDIECDQSELARQLQLIPGAGVPGNRVRRLASNRLDVFYGQGEPADLRDALGKGIPPIVLVHTAELPYWTQAAAHAVVLLAMDETSVVVNDPGIEEAATELSLGDFLLAWDEMANLYALISKK